MDNLPNSQKCYRWNQNKKCTHRVYTKVILWVFLECPVFQRCNESVFVYYVFMFVLSAFHGTEWPIVCWYTIKKFTRSLEDSIFSVFLSDFVWELSNWFSVRCIDIWVADRSNTYIHTYTHTESTTDTPTHTYIFYLCNMSNSQRCSGRNGTWGTCCLTFHSKGMWSSIFHQSDDILLHWQFTWVVYND